MTTHSRLLACLALTLLVGSVSVSVSGQALDAQTSLTEFMSHIAVFSERDAVAGTALPVDVFFVPASSSCSVQVTRGVNKGAEVLRTVPCEMKGNLHHTAQVALDFGEGKFGLVAVATDQGGKPVESRPTQLEVQPGEGAEGGGSNRMVVETDKPIYKPGARMQTRVLVFDGKTAPSNGVSVTLLVRTPDGITISRTVNTTDEFGAVEFSLPLSAEPPLGEYTLAASAGSATAEAKVAVERYVLPKVQVSASVKEPYVHQPDKTKPFDLNGEISATYTAGGGATGTAYARLYVSCQWWQYQRNVPSAKESDLTSDGYKLVTTTEPQDLVDGASKFTFSGIAASEALQCLGQYNTQFHAATLRVEAYVYEVTSGKTTKETVDVPLRYGQLYDMSVLSSYQYMPGRPYNLRAKVTLPDGSPAPAGVTFYMKVIRTVYVREAYNDDKGSQNEILPVTTSGDGMIVLDVDTNDSADSCCTNEYKFNVWSGESRSGSRECCLTSIRLEFYENAAARDQASAMYSHYLSRASSRAGTAIFVSAKQHDESAGKITAEVTHIGYPFTNGAIAYSLSCSTGVISAGTAVATAGAASTVVEVQYDTATRCDGLAVLVVFAQRSGSLLAASCDVEGVGQVGTGVLSAIGKDATTASFPSDTAQPGENIDIKLEAPGRPKSRVYMVAVDKSVSLLAGQSALKLADIEAALKETTASLPGTDESIRMCSFNSGAALYAGAVSVTSPLDFSQCYTYFDDVAFGGGGMVEDAMPVMAGDMARDGVLESAPTAAPKAAEDPSSSNGAEKKTRKFFPETWIFSSAYLGESTSGAFRTTVPDTMTTWMLHSYGISSSGLSLGSAISNLTVAKPLYVRASLPYSVLRDEVATIRVGVFNGKSSAANVELNVAAASASSDALKILCVDGSASTSGDSANGCRSSLQVAPSSSAVFVVQVQALAIGVQRIVTSATSTDGLTDTIEQQLLVEPPGETEEIPLNEMLMLDASGESSTKEVKMETIVPTGAIAPRFVFSATGDIMGPSMEGIENLLQVPYGCGEQNMIGLAPNVYVLDYLKATSAEGDPVYTRALSQGTANMAKGYQRQLQYMHSDGSFSAFGEQSACGCGFGDVRAEGANEENKAYGSTWLTAFVLRVFAGVSKYTYVDESILNKAKDYLLSVQKSDGSFEERGRVIHQEMMGGVADKELSLTAYVLLSLAEAGAGIVTDAPTSTAQLVSQRVGSATGGYGVAIGAYALQAACKTWGSQMCTLANSAQQALDKIKVQGGGGVHWVGGTGEAPSSKAEPVQEDMRIAMFAPPRTKSSDVETTAYALLSVTRSQQNDLANLVATGMAVVRWLSNQRNGQGGFRSTQDTVVALQALSSYSMATSSLAGAHALEVDFAAPIVGSLLPKKITIDDSTSKVLQRFDLDSKTVPIAADGSIKFELSASGKGVALVQLVLRYNKLGKAADNPSYTIDATWRPTSPIVNLTSAKRRSGESQYPAKANVTACFAPTSEIKNDPGMTLVRVQAFSGYEFDADALQELTEMPGSIVQRADVDAKGADLYVDSQARGYSFREKICLTLPANKAHDVSGLGPATASVQAYYNPETKAAISTESKALLDTKSSGDGGSGHPVSVGGEPVTTRAPYIPPEKPPPVPTSGAQNLRWFVAATAVVIGVLFA